MINLISQVGANNKVRLIPKLIMIPTIQELKLSIMIDSKTNQDNITLQEPIPPIMIYFMSQDGAIYKVRVIPKFIEIT